MSGFLFVLPIFNTRGGNQFPGCSGPEPFDGHIFHDIIIFKFPNAHNEYKWPLEDNYSHCEVRTLRWLRTVLWLIIYFKIFTILNPWSESGSIIFSFSAVITDVKTLSVVKRRHCQLPDTSLMADSAVV